MLFHMISLFIYLFIYLFFATQSNDDKHGCHFWIRSLITLMDFTREQKDGVFMTLKDDRISLFNHPFFVSFAHF